MLIMFWTSSLMSLLSSELLQLMKGYSRFMNLQHFLASLLSSPWETLLPLATLVALMVTLPRCLLLFVNSLIQGKKSKKTSELLTQTSEQFLTMIFQFLSLPLKTEQSINESPMDCPPEEFQEHLPEEPAHPDPDQQLTVQSLIERIKEVIDYA